MTIRRPVVETGPDGRQRVRYVEEQVQHQPDSHGPIPPSPVTPARRGQQLQTEADRRSLEIAQRLRGSRDEEQREQLRRELAELLGQAFDQRREHQQREIERLEARLQEIRELDQRRAERKDEIVRRRLAELTGQPDALAWDIGPIAGPSKDPRPAPGLPARTGPVDTLPRAPRPAADDPFAQPPASATPPRPGDAPERLPADDSAGRQPTSAAVDPREADPFRSFSPSRSQESDGAALHQIARDVLAAAEKVAERAEAVAKAQATTLAAENELTKLREQAASIGSDHPDRHAALSQFDSFEATLNRLKASTERSKAALRQAEAELRLAELAWKHHGSEIKEQLDWADQSRAFVAKQASRIEILHREGRVSSEKMSEAHHERKQAESQYAAAQRRFATWAEADKIVRARLAELSAPAAATDNDNDTDNESDDADDNDNAVQPNESDAPTDGAELPDASDSD